MNTAAKIVLIGLITGILSSCTSGTTSTAAAVQVNISGTWLGDFLSELLSTDMDVNPTEAGRISAVVTLTINQDEENKLTGIANISDPETNCFAGGPITGEISQSTYTITIDDGFGSDITLTGQATETTLEGVYSATAAGERCPPHTGEANFAKST